MRRASGGVVLAIAFTMASIDAADHDNWPRFRGLHAGVIPDSPNLPERWGQVENVAWKVDIPGLSWSSPIVWGDHVIVTSVVSAGKEPPPEKGLYDPGTDHGKTRATAPHRWFVHDIDFQTGRTRWVREVAQRVPPIGRHIKNSFASETPTTDGERIYAYFGGIGLIVALDFEGKTIWSQEVPTGETYYDMGTAASPIVHSGRVFIVNDNLTNSYMLAFDARTGTIAWRAARDENDKGATWSTPFVWENERRTEVVTNASGKIRSYDVAGQLLWELRGPMTMLTVPSPFASHGLAFFGLGYPGDAPRPVYAVRPGAHGDITLKPGETSNDYIARYQPLLGTYNTSALVYGDHYYTLLDRGFLLCHDARTGKQVYGRQRTAPGVSGFTASPWAYNGKIFILSEDGDTFVIQAGPEFKVLGKNSLDEMTLATPAIVRDSVILRTQSKLYRIAKPTG